mmetsp:Transcript_97642/g.315251  ORF Transcript_97642/g.315251 Transcript_97642/m.315251 type:complete len:262 (-) Transcript_97642:237-1022(-)
MKLLPSGIVAIDLAEVAIALAMGGAPLAELCAFWVPVEASKPAEGRLPPEPVLVFHLAEPAVDLRAEGIPQHRNARHVVGPRQADPPENLAAFLLGESVAVSQQLPLGDRNRGLRGRSRTRPELRHRGLRPIMPVFRAGRGCNFCVFGGGAVLNRGAAGVGPGSCAGTDLGRSAFARVRCWWLPAKLPDPIPELLQVLLALVVLREAPVGGEVPPTKLAPIASALPRWQRGQLLGPVLALLQPLVQPLRAGPRFPIPAVMP